MTRVIQRPHQPCHVAQRAVRLTTLLQRDRGFALEINEHETTVGAQDLTQMQIPVNPLRGYRILGQLRVQGSGLILEGRHGR